MAKEKKQIVISDEALSSTTIGKLDNQTRKPIALIIMIIIFIVVAIFMPNISSFVNNILYPEDSNPVKVTQKEKDKTKKKTEKSEETEVSYYDFSPELIISTEIFSISDFAINDGVLSLNINNSKNEELNFFNYKYYLELYNDEDTLIQRIKISYGNIAALGSNNYQFDLVDQKFTKMLLVTKNLEDYPEVAVPEESSIYSLSCNKGKNILTFNFLNKELYTIDNMISFSKNDAEYELNYNNFKNSTQNLAPDGITYKFADVDDGFNYTAAFDLNKLNEATIKLGNYDVNFKLKTLIKEVKFDMESSGYSCQ